MFHFEPAMLRGENTRIGMLEQISLAESFNVDFSCYYLKPRKKSKFFTTAAERRKKSKKYNEIEIAAIRDGVPPSQIVLNRG